MAEEKKAPAYVSDEPAPALPPIQVLADKPKRRIPLWLIIMFVICAWLSGMAIMVIYFLAAQKQKTETVPVVVPHVVTATPSKPTVALQKQTNSSKNIYTNTQYGYTLEIPTTWRALESDNVTWLYDGAAKTKEPPSPYAFGRVTVKYEDKTEQKIMPWFDLKYPQGEGRASTPVKKKTYVNAQGVETLETDTLDPDGWLRYYFIANGQVVSLSFNITTDAEVNKTLQVIYGQIIDSITVIPPSVPTKSS